MPGIEISGNQGERGVLVITDVATKATYKSADEAAKALGGGKAASPSKAAAKAAPKAKAGKKTAAKRK